MHSLSSVFDWKVSLLIEGCRVAPGTTFSDTVSMKKIHLYAHSSEEIDQPIPDDLLLPNGMIVRVRYRSNSRYLLQVCINGYQVVNEKTGESIPIELIPRANFSRVNASGLPISSICSLLGKDLLGIIPSNYCFYFQNRQQCRFCEILPTFKNEVEFHKSFKSLEIIEESILGALKSDKNLRYIAITTGNIQSYDWTVDYFIQIGERLQKDPTFQKAEQVLATLMPPDDLSKLVDLKDKGFTKIYFPLEVFDPGHFSIVCPGKAEYGYDRILKALDAAVEVFGIGNVYTNFVYGIQSLNSSLDGSSYDPEKENNLCIEAVEALLARSVIPAFTLYHYGGYNSIKNINLSTASTNAFFRKWGELVYYANIVPKNQEAVIFSFQSLSNTLFNDGFRLTQQKECLV